MYGTSYSNNTCNQISTIATYILSALLAVTVTALIALFLKLMKNKAGVKTSTVNIIHTPQSSTADNVQ